MKYFLINFRTLSDREIVVESIRCRLFEHLISIKYLCSWQFVKNDSSDANAPRFFQTSGIFENKCNKICTIHSLDLNQ